MSPTLESLVKELSVSVSDYKDPSGAEGRLKRKDIIRLANKITNEVEDPRERIFDEYGVRMAEIPIIRVLMGWKAFDYIPENGGISYANLAAKLNAEEGLIRRFCWLLLSTGFLKQTGEDQVTHTKISKVFISANPQGAYFKITFDLLAVPAAQWAQYFEKYGRIEPVEPSHNPHNFAWGDDGKMYWDLFTESRFEDMNCAMQNLDGVLPVTGMFPFKWIAENAKLVADNAPLVVDVGGGRGQALQRMMEECPDIPAERLVLQDREEVLEEGKRLDEPALRGVKRQAIDFFEDEPVKGALVYYLRRIMHDWSDKYNVQILSHIRNAMTPHSRVLITDQVIQNPPSTIATSTDIMMMQMGAKERSVAEWYSLAEKADLEVVKIWQHPSTTVAVTECRKKA